MSSTSRNSENDLNHYSSLEQGNSLKGIVIWFVRRQGIEPIKSVSSPTLFVKVEVKTKYYILKLLSKDHRSSRNQPDDNTL
jgi:hypothetical protein